MTQPTPAELELLRAKVRIGLAMEKLRPWVPLPGPQTMAYESTADIVGYGGAAGGGKGLDLSTPIPTPLGWTAMRDLQVGDEVFDDAGQVCRVTAVSDPVLRPCYRLRFDDGSELVADDVHRWVTFDAKELARLTRSDPAWRAARRAKRPCRGTGKRPDLALRNSAWAEGGPPPKGTMRDTQELAATLLTPAGRRNHAVAVAGPLSLPALGLPVDPYVLGVWLGDGSSANSDVTGIDDELWQHVEACGETVTHSAKDQQRHVIRGLKPRLRALGVLGNKHVPEDYLRGSEEQRRALLQGLMDTDGHAALDGGCEFDNTKLCLAQAVQDLALGLGLKATLLEGRAKIDGRDCGAKWRVKFTTDQQVFRLSRKQSRLGPVRRVGAFRYLVACDPCPTVWTRCIAVDSPSRQYLAGRSLIPTHNTDLACGKAITQHRKTMILRRVGTELTGIMDRLEELIGSRDAYNGKDKIWKFERKRDRAKLQIEMASIPNAGDETGYQGRPHDLLIFDEASNFLEGQVRFLMGWVRTTIKGQRCQVLMTFNPPTTSEGRWIVSFFAPWLDPKHPNPAQPGELRWFAVIAGEDIEVDDGTPFELNGERIEPQSRTFIPSRVADNPYLVGTGYLAQLQSLPEPLRSQMLYGDFMAGMQDDERQVIPTAWVEAAMNRWTHREVKPRMDSMGVDVARGGRDKTVISRRHGNWFDRMLRYDGAETPDGPKVASLVIAANRDLAPVHIDVIGVGSSPYDFLVAAKQQIMGINVSEKALGTDKSGRLRFLNQRSELWWKMREALDPANNQGIELPPDPRLKADLCAPLWEARGPIIVVEDREAIWKRIRRSPDDASAVLLAMLDTPRLTDIPGMLTGMARGDYDPYRQASDHRPRNREYDPYR